MSTARPPGRSVASAVSTMAKSMLVVVILLFGFLKRRGNSLFIPRPSMMVPKGGFMITTSFFWLLKAPSLRASIPVGLKPISLSSFRRSGLISFATTICPFGLASIRSMPVPAVGSRTRLAVSTPASWLAM